MVTHLLFQITIKHNLLFSGEELLDTLEIIKPLLLFRKYVYLYVQRFICEATAFWVEECVLMC